MPPRGRCLGNLGGRWSDEAVTFISELAAARAREAPPVLRKKHVVANDRDFMRTRICVFAGVNFLGVDGVIPDLTDLSCET